MRQVYRRGRTSPISRSRYKGRPRPELSRGPFSRSEDVTVVLVVPPVPAAGVVQFRNVTRCRLFQGPLSEPSSQPTTSHLFRKQHQRFWPPRQAHNHAAHERCHAPTAELDQPPASSALFFNPNVSRRETRGTPRQCSVLARDDASFATCLGISPELLPAFFLSRPTSIPASSSAQLSETIRACPHTPSDPSPCSIRYQSSPYCVLRYAGQPWQITSRAEPLIGSFPFGSANRWDHDPAARRHRESPQLTASHRTTPTSSRIRA